MKRNKLTLADAALKSAHNSQPLSTCPLCLGHGKCEARLASLTSETIARARDSINRHTPMERAQLPKPVSGANRQGQRTSTKNLSQKNPTVSVRLPPLEQGSVPARASDSWPQQAIKGKMSTTSLPPINNPKKNCSFFIDLNADLEESAGDTPTLPPIAGASDSPSRKSRAGEGGFSEGAFALSRNASACSGDAKWRARSGTCFAGAKVSPSDSVISEPARRSTRRSNQRAPSSTQEKASSDQPTTSYDSADPLTGGAGAETFRQAMTDIGTSDWDTIVDGLTSVIRVLKYAPEVCDGADMPVLMRTVTSLVRSLRSKVAICACRTAYALFKRAECTRRPEFDQLVGSLLVRTGDMNKFLRHEALRSLTAMAEYIPILNSVRALMEQGARNKNDLVRAATAQMMSLVVECQGPGILIDKREIREKLFPVIASLLEDSHPDTRAFAKKTFSTLSLDDRFCGYFKTLIRANQIIRLQKIVGPLH